MEVRGYCTACGNPGEVSGQFLCELCAGVGRTVLVCRNCKARRETNRAILRRSITETGDGHLLPDDDSCGVTMAIDWCSQCVRIGETRKNIMTFYVIKSPTVQ